MAESQSLAPVGDKVTDKDYFGTGFWVIAVRQVTPSCSEIQYCAGKK
ncbi:hypothetical protein KCP71_22840 [Salmonella enterica subsp. enterica]|nr:hypothetical protein KCP71_22840 [Salmonella enterica subsp. enterica]